MQLTNVHYKVFRLKTARKTGRATYENHPIKNKNAILFVMINRILLYHSLTSGANTFIRKAWATKTSSEPRLPTIHSRYFYFIMCRLIFVSVFNYYACCFPSCAKWSGISGRLKPFNRNGSSYGSVYDISQKVQNCNFIVTAEKGNPKCFHYTPGQSRALNGTYRTLPDFIWTFERRCDRQRVHSGTGIYSFAHLLAFISVCVRVFCFDFFSDDQVRLSPQSLVFLSLLLWLFIKHLNSPHASATDCTQISAP